MEERKFIIHTSNLEAFQNKITKLNNKALKLKLPTFDYTLDKANNGFINAYVCGPLKIQSSGWEFICSLSHINEQECLIINFLEKPFPDKFKHSGSVCEHCWQNRKRNKTYILFNEQEGLYKQVGSTCLSEFFKTSSIDSLDKQLDFIEKSYETILSFKNEDVGNPTFDLKDFLAKTLYEIETNGWMPKSKADGVERHPTYLNVLNNYDSIECTNTNYSKAIDIISYIENLKEESSYIENLKTIARLGFVEYKLIGLAASMPSIYNRSITSIKTSSDYFGKPKDKIKVILKFIRSASFGSNFGMVNLFTFEDSNSNVFVWKTTTYNEFVVGEKYQVCATIKEHNVYKDVKQTVLSRCEYFKL